ncbi:MAG: hypothetical protein BGO27_05895 [Alphaproteobacteria bacterium 33-17]|nr:MAG: hypothetical protein BGO27_05895 [Alphaproteobacteria bacterium 33-17]
MYNKSGKTLKNINKMQSLSGLFLKKLCITNKIRNNKNLAYILVNFLTGMKLVYIKNNLQCRLNNLKPNYIRR